VGFILAGPKWLRYGVKAPEGYVLIAVDIKSEEYVLAAAFGGEQEELDAYYHGEDAFLGYPIRLGDVPEGANRETEPDLVKRKHYVAVRKKFKTVSHGTTYGQGAASLAARIGVSLLKAQIILNDFKRLRKKYWDWSDSQIAAARKTGYIETAFGWRVHVYPSLRRGKSSIGTKTTTLINFPVQSAGAEVLRLASVFLERAGYGQNLSSPHHDAIYALAPVPKALEVAGAIEAAFGKAGDLVMDGKGRFLMDTGFYPTRIVIPTRTEPTCSRLWTTSFGTCLM
jgi:DNA polymerase I-like protein with 3'-5' exonuclease and polymerase domains